jgi:hypothetical protein
MEKDYFYYRSPLSPHGNMEAGPQIGQYCRWFLCGDCKLSGSACSIPAKDGFGIRLTFQSCFSFEREAPQPKEQV